MALGTESFVILTVLRGTLLHCIFEAKLLFVPLGMRVLFEQANGER